MYIFDARYEQNLLKQRFWNALEEFQSHTCDLIYVEDWSPAFDGISNRPMDEITGYFCEVHCCVSKAPYCESALLTMIQGVPTELKALLLSDYRALAEG